MLGKRFERLGDCGTACGAMTGLMRYAFLFAVQNAVHPPLKLLATDLFSSTMPR